MDVGWRISAGRDQDGRRIRKTVYAQTQAEAQAKLIDLQARYLDLTVERSIFGSSRVAHAPMWDSGLRQHPRRWSAAVHFAARALDDSPDIRVFISLPAGAPALGFGRLRPSPGQGSLRGDSCQPDSPPPSRGLPRSSVCFKCRDMVCSRCSNTAWSVRENDYQPPHNFVSQCDGTPAIRRCALLSARPP